MDRWQGKKALNQVFAGRFPTHFNWELLTPLQGMKSGNQATSHADQRIPFWLAILFIGRFHPSLFAGPLSRLLMISLRALAERTERPLNGSRSRLDRPPTFPDDLPAPSGDGGYRDTAPAAHSSSDPFNRPARWSRTPKFPRSCVPCRAANASRNRHQCPNF
jgi:hypothetical protein